MKTLITGGYGLVGRALFSIIPESEKDNYIFLDSPSRGGTDLLNIENTSKLFEKYKPDKVVHLAALVGGLYKNMNDNLGMYKNNLIMNMNIIECCHKYNVKKSVFCLSTCIFPDITEGSYLSYPISELDLHKGPPHSSNKGYSYAKRMTQVHTELYNDFYIKNNMPNRMICIIPTNVYGEHDNFHLQDGHVIPSLIHQCYLAVNENRPFVIRGTGVPKRQFMYSQDLAYLALWVLENFSEKTNSIILAPDETDEYSISKVAKYIKESFESYYGKDIDLQFDCKYADGQFRKTASNKLLKSLTLFEFTDLKNGINKTVKWFIKNYKTVRK